MEVADLVVPVFAVIVGLPCSTQSKIQSDALGRPDQSQQSQSAPPLAVQ